MRNLIPFRVRHFNKSLRCCKLLYTALHMLWLEVFFDETQTTKDTIDCVNHLKSTMNKIPSEFASDDVARTWFVQLLEDIEQSNLSGHLSEWTTHSIKTNITFRLWFFVLRHLLQPLLELYISVRTCNFSARNAALYQFAPLFFSTNHRNYSRLCAQHLYDLQMSSPYLLGRMAGFFAVNRSQCRFSSKLTCVFIKIVLRLLKVLLLIKQLNVPLINTEKDPVVLMVDLMNSQLITGYILLHIEHFLVLIFRKFVVLRRKIIQLIHMSNVLQIGKSSMTRTCQLS